MVLAIGFVVISSLTTATYMYWSVQFSLPEMGRHAGVAAIGAAYLLVFLALVSGFIAGIATVVLLARKGNFVSLKTFPAIGLSCLAGLLTYFAPYTIGAICHYLPRPLMMLWGALDLGHYIITGPIITAFIINKLVSRFRHFFSKQT